MDTLPERFCQLMMSKGYQLIQHNGQRVITSPNYMELYRPESGCEIFVGNLPRNLFEDVLFPMFSTVGEILCLRLMLEHTGKNRGYCFITYKEKKSVQLAIHVYNHFQIRPERMIGVYKSVDNCRLFLGGIDTHLSANDIRTILSPAVEGVTGVIVYPNYSNYAQNRGFAFVTFYTHKYASIARRKLHQIAFDLFKTRISVDWAEPIPEVADDIMEKVTKLFIRNVNPSYNNETLLHQINMHVPPNKVVRVRKIKNFAFVHFLCRQDAQIAFDVLKFVNFGYVSNPSQLEWARPRVFSKDNLQSVPPGNFCLSVPPRTRRLVNRGRNNSSLRN